MSGVVLTQSLFCLGVAGPTVAGGSYLHSSSESITSVHSVPPSKPQRTHFKGSNQSLRSFGSKRGGMYELYVNVIGDREKCFRTYIHVLIVSLNFISGI